MEAKNKEFTNGTVTIVWQPKKCFHSTRCINGLPEVFDPSKTPWINIEGSDSEHIINQVKKCPSGALSYYLNEELKGNTVSAVIEVREDGPYLVHGKIKLEDLSGKVSIKEGPFALCRCGASENKPFCDSSHLKTDFNGK